MPAQAQGKKFNPTVSRVYLNDKFGEDAMLSTKISAADFDLIQNNLEINSKFLLRKSPKLDKNGGEYWFLEILPPMATDTTSKFSGRSKAKATNNNTGASEIG